MYCWYFSLLKRPRFACPPQRSVIFFMPSSSHSFFASLRTTGMPFCTKHMAMPPPISPAPRMPIFLRGAGLSSTPGTFCAMRSAKKTWRRAADCTEKTSLVNSAISTSRPSRKLLPEHAASKHLMMPAGATISGCALKAVFKPASNPPAATMKRLVLGTSLLEIGAGGWERANSAASAMTSPAATASMMPFFLAASAFIGRP
mmetsp:Transcript_49233/g.88516  ORF Transcript_49233/g.88516 Transcript_49233/m.88516 type:complete len:202 (+) Transcript_49233:849-1454(+)